MQLTEVVTIITFSSAFRRNVTTSVNDYSQSNEYVVYKEGDKKSERLHRYRQA